MKRFTITLFILLCFIFCPATAFAHPPKTPDISWDAKSNTLTVKATHVVNDPAKHFVFALVVLDSKGQSIETKQYTMQSSAQTFSDSVQLKGIMPGDTIKVRLVCNIMGATETTVVLK